MTTPAHFNPRPLRGGRLVEYQTMQYIKAFQSPPSVRKATENIYVVLDVLLDFNPRLP